MHSLMNYTAHRPSPLPSRPWIIFQTWEHLLFAHWPVDARKIAPFRTVGARLRMLPPIPGLSDYDELNFRTYVRTASGPPGVYFLSIGASKRIIVEGAKRLFRLPYHYADMTVATVPNEPFHIQCRYRMEQGASASEVEFQCRFAPSSSSYGIRKASIENWLYDRYCLYTSPHPRLSQQMHETNRPNCLLVGDIHHPPWLLKRVELEIERNTIGKPFGIELPALPHLSTFTRRMGVLGWTLRKLEC
ncbi:YqjF family protein [Paenibacillus sp. MSJ-34]|uniref:YqjF family protein n=1 Tax=Paenibacillus sp. MSJ-34 TaxID=2841529 RepID=UPI001C106037|nr:DUF2071 domain-containing protein [Paenibacillus sp. MSJ-34]MBU5442990.1 DUF2071 domain-containing protein [Paenibacillus sp. MSJ-34]